MFLKTKNKFKNQQKTKVMKTNVILTANGIDKTSSHLFIQSKFKGDVSQLSNLFAGTNMYMLLDEVLKPFKGNSEINFLIEFTELNASFEFKGKKSGGNALAIVNILSAFQNVVRANSGNKIDMKDFEGQNAATKREF